MSTKSPDNLKVEQHRKLKKTVHVSSAGFGWIIIWGVTVRVQVKAGLVSSKGASVVTQGVIVIKVSVKGGD